MDSTKPRIRPAVPGDLTRLVDMRGSLQQHMLAGTPNLFDLTPGWRERKRTHYQTCIEDRDRLLTVACDPDGDTIVGMGLASVIDNPELQPTRFGAIDDIWVEPAARRSGVGSAIVAELLLFFEGRGLEQLTLSFATGNVEAKAFWTKLGFQPALVMANGRTDALRDRLGRG